MTTPDYWPTIGHEHWAGTSYDQAMQLGIESLRSSYTMPGEQGEAWILFGQRQALQAAAWFAFARERREAEYGPPAGGPPGPLDAPRRPDPPLG
jgi:hypothetical protein